MKWKYILPVSAWVSSKNKPIRGLATLNCHRCESVSSLSCNGLPSHQRCIPTSHLRSVPYYWKGLTLFVIVLYNTIPFVHEFISEVFCQIYSSLSSKAMLWAGSKVLSVKVILFELGVKRLSQIKPIKAKLINRQSDSDV